MTVLPEMIDASLAVHGRLLLRELRGRQRDVAPELQALRGPRGQLSGHETSACDVRFLRFVETCEQLADDASFGLRAGQRVQLDDLELMGLLLRASSDGRAVLDTLQRHRDRWSSSSGLDLELGVSSARVVQRPLGDTLVRSRVLAECALARTLSIVRMMLGQWVKPQRVELTFSQPSDCAALEAFFGAPLHFDAARNALTFSVDLLSARLPHRDPALARVLERHLLKSLAVAPEPREPSVRVVERVREVLSVQLATGNTGLPHIAALLDCSERTLRRHLQRAGTSYQELLDDQRRQLALDHLREHPGRSAVLLSDALGFSNPAAFYRAFKRWTGARWSAYQDPPSSPLSSASL